jgi:hypothetical protein
MTKKLTKIVVVIWNDAHALSDSWGKFEVKDHKPREVHSVGYVLKSDDVGVSIAQSWDSQCNDDHALFVPRGMVVSEELL